VIAAPPPQPTFTAVDRATTHSEPSRPKANEPSNSADDDWLNAVAAVLDHTARKLAGPHEELDRTPPNSGGGGGGRGAGGAVDLVSASLMTDRATSSAPVVSAARTSGPDAASPMRRSGHSTANGGSISPVVVGGRGAAPAGPRTPGSLGSPRGGGGIKPLILAPGSFVEYLGPTHSPWHITNGPDAKRWFTEIALVRVSPQIGNITTAGSSGSSPSATRSMLVAFLASLTSPDYKDLGPGNWRDSEPWPG
jgi:hypothetical protein